MGDPMDQWKPQCLGMTPTKGETEAAELAVAGEQRDKVAAGVRAG